MEKRNIEVSDKTIQRSESSNVSVESLIKAGARTERIYDYPSAIDLYTQALTREEITPDLVYSIMDQRAECYDRMGQLKNELDDLDKMVEIANELGNPEMQMAIVYRQVYTAARMGENKKLRQIAESAMFLARESDEESVNAGASLALGYYHSILERYSEAQDELEKALRLYRAIGDSEGEANSLLALSSVILNSGKQTLAGKYALDALAIWRNRGERKREASALNAWSLTLSDYAQEIDSKGGALEIFKEIGDHWGQGQMFNNLSLLYGHMGLYSTARHYAEQAVEMAREMGARLALALFLDSLARAEMNMQDFERAQATFEECRILSREISSRNIEGFVLLGLGRVALASGRAEEAKGLIQETLNIFRETKLASDIPTALAWLGAAYLALDESKTARKYTAEGVTEQEAIGLGGSEYPPQEVWWWHYQALTHELHQGKRSKVREDKSSVNKMPDNAWSVLQRAREITLEGIISLSDEGLRRNYLNKVGINREIIAEWAKQSAIRGLDLEVEDSRPGNVQAQLQRLLAIGVRMNERREVRALTDFIMEELIELSGAERAMLVLQDETRKREIAAGYGFLDGDMEEILVQASDMLDRVDSTRQPVLNQEVNHGDLNKPAGDPLKSLSVLCVPLLSRGQMIGMIYADNHEIYGRFTQADVDLLAAFANQVAAAIENARLYQGLEQRVEQRTAELSISNASLEQRNAELGIINSVQEGLATELDFYEIIELVGNKIRETFDIQFMSISILDRINNQIEIPFFLENGKRFPTSPFPFNENSGVIAYVLKTRKPLLVHENLQKISEELGSKHSMGDDDAPMAESMVQVPILMGDEAIGTIGLFDHQPNMFEEEDLRLLTTLANSMSVALENARLFNETKRLLDETQRRTAELSIINSVQEALASKLEFQSVIDFVGDKLQDVLSTKSIDIRLIDKNTNLVHYLYMVEHGERFNFPPAPLSGISKYMAETMEPLIINEGLEDKIAQIGSYTLPGTDTAKSLIAVPFTIREDSIGLIIVENYDKEHAFSDSDLSLLMTLAASMSVALENARLFDETNRLLEESEQRSAELVIINSVQEGLAEELDIPSIFELVGEKIREIFDAQVVMISTFDHERRIRHFPFNIEKGVRSTIDPLPFNQLTTQLIETRKPVVINQDVIGRGEELGMSTAPGTETPKSLVFVPMIAGDSVVGFVSLQNIDRENAFPESAVRLLNTMTSSMSVALENARLFDETNRLLEETQQRAAELTTVNTVSQALSSELELEALIDLIGEQVNQIFSADITYVALLDQQTYLIEFPYAVGEDLEAMPFGEGLTSKIIESGEPLLINENVNETVDGIGATHTGVDVQSYLGVPIMVGGQAIGVISVQSVKEAGQFNDDDVRLLGTIAANVGAAIRNAQLYQETQQRADEMAALTEIGREISATLDLKDVLERIATRARDLLSARTATIRLVEGDGSLPTVVAIGKHAEKHSGTTIQMGEGITGNVAKSGRAEIVNDPRHDARIVHVPGIPQEEDEFEAILFAPLMVGERVIGVMGLWRDKLVAGPFTKDDLNFLQSLARQAANAIENARLFEEVQRQKQYSEALLQNSPVAIMTTDLDNLVVSWNPAAENLFGYQANEAIGVNIRDLISNESIEKDMSEIYEQLRGGGRVNTVTQRFRKDGSPVDVELLSLPVVMDGKKVGLIAIYHDITELLRARKEAEAANEAKSAFLATMSHEIRTPMNGVIGMTSLLLDTELDAEQRDFTETIRNSGEALLTVINDILDFSKIEAGKMELEEQPFNLRKCLESSLDLLKFNASDKGVELAYQMEPDVPTVIVGDITRLRQVLINLLNNGLKFTEQGEVVLSVSTRAVPIHPDGPYTLHFSVCDTGIGIPPERLDRLFQAFSQVDASTSRKYGGTGLGLAISKRLSELMGGEMWVESVVSEGTTFHFTIIAQAGPAMQERDDLRGEQPQLSGKRILIVDDNLTNRRILTLQTRAWGMLPRYTSAPQEALKWVKQGDPFDLAILDYHMPGMDGIELSHAIREVANFPLVLFSSIGSRETAREEDQFTAFLSKPLKPSVLLDTLMNLFAGEAKKVEHAEGAEKIGFDPELADKMPLLILLVEDNAVNQKLALRLLEQMGYRADLAGNGLEAIQAVSRQKYDVLLMDVQMPEMDGLEASRRICARWPRGERPHIIAMTANAMQGDRERCLAAGMDDYVSKPIRVNELVAALAKATPTEIRGEEMAKTRRN